MRCRRSPLKFNLITLTFFFILFSLLSILLSCSNHPNAMYTGRNAQMCFKTVKLVAAEFPSGSGEAGFWPGYNQL